MALTILLVVKRDLELLYISVKYVTFYLKGRSENGQSWLS